MKKIITTLIIIVALSSSCKKAEEMKYSSSGNIFFNFDDDRTKDRDSVIYTFAYAPEKVKDTVFMPVSISGNREPVARKFKVEVIAANTTAQAGMHYEALKTEYIMPANAGKTSFPVIVFNTDASLTSRAVILNFRLIASEDFRTDIINMTTGKLVLSNKLEKPYWWGPGLKTWDIPNYSQVKHELWLIATGVIDLPFDGLVAPQFLYYSGLLSSLLNNPSTWIANNPGRKYVLELRPDGNYDFYNTSNPTKKTLYKKNTQTGKFFFIDENGKEVI